MNPYWSFLIPSAPNEPRMRWPGVSHSAQVALRSQGPARPAPWPKAFLLILFILILNGTSGGFPVMGVSPIAGWFISGKIPSINGWWLGVALWLRKPPIHKGWSAFDLETVGMMLEDNVRRGSFSLWFMASYGIQWRRRSSRCTFRFTIRDLQGPLAAGKAQLWIGEISSAQPWFRLVGIRILDGISRNWDGIGMISAFHKLFQAISSYFGV